MRISFLAMASLTLAGFGHTAFAQDSDSSFSEQTPAENVRAAQSRAPGQVVKLAIAQHRARSDARLAAQRAGDTSVLAPVLPDFLGGGGNSLTNLLGSLLGGITGSGDIGSLLNGLGSGATTENAGGVGSTGTGGAAPANSNVPSNITPEAVELLEANGFNVNDLFAQSRDPVPAGTAIQPDKTTRQQTADTQASFSVRWADAMLSTLFTALTIGFQTPDFVDFLVGILTPPEAPAEAPDNTASGNDTDAADGTPVDVNRDPNSIVLRILGGGQGWAAVA